MEERNALSMAWDEYKILQDKLDRLGDFRFRVRGWVITIVTGLIAAGLSTRVPWYVYLLTAISLSGFHLMERTQSTWQRVFSNRADEIEDYLRVNPAFASPGITTAVRNERRRLRRSWSRVLVVHDEAVFFTIMYGLLMGVSVVKAPWLLSLLNWVQMLLAR